MPNILLSKSAIEILIPQNKLCHASFSSRPLGRAVCFYFCLGLHVGKEEDGVVKTENELSVMSDHFLCVINTSNLRHIAHT